MWPLHDKRAEGSSESSAIATTEGARGLRAATARRQSMLERPVLRENAPLEVMHSYDPMPHKMLAPKSHSAPATPANNGDDTDNMTLDPVAEKRAMAQQDLLYQPINEDECQELDSVIVSLFNQDETAEETRKRPAYDSIKSASPALQLDQQQGLLPEHQAGGQPRKRQRAGTPTAECSGSGNAVTYPDTLPTPPPAPRLSPEQEEERQREQSLPPPPPPPFAHMPFYPVGPPPDFAPHDPHGHPHARTCMPFPSVYFHAPPYTWLHHPHMCVPVQPAPTAGRECSANPNGQAKAAAEVKTEPKSAKPAKRASRKPAITPRGSNKNAAAGTANAAVDQAAADQGPKKKKVARKKIEKGKVKTESRPHASEAALALSLPKEPLAGSLLSQLRETEQTHKPNPNPKPKPGRDKTLGSVASRRWTKEEDDKLRKSVHQFNAQNWKSIASLVPGRDHVQCLQRWKKVLKPGLVKGAWQPHEDKILIQLINQPGVKGWAQIACEIPGRTPKQCRERWSITLDPSINRSAWTEEEDEKLLTLHRKYGNAWAEIRHFFNGRTENAVKTRFNNLVRAKKRDESITWTPQVIDQLVNLAKVFENDLAEIRKHLPRALKGISSKAIRRYCPDAR